MCLQLKYPWHLPSPCFPMLSDAPGNKHWKQYPFLLSLWNLSFGVISTCFLQAQYWIISVPLGLAVAIWSSFLSQKQHFFSVLWLVKHALLLPFCLPSQFCFCYSFSQQTSLESTSFTVVLSDPSQWILSISWMVYDHHVSLHAALTTILLLDYHQANDRYVLIYFHLIILIRCNVLMLEVVILLLY